MDGVEFEVMSRASLSPPGSDSEESKSDESKDLSIKSLEPLESTNTSSGAEEDVVYSVSENSSNATHLFLGTRKSWSLSSNVEGSGTATFLDSPSAAAIKSAEQYSIVIQLRARPMHCQDVVGVRE